MKYRGIVSGLTITNNPRQNGVDERLHRTLMGLVHAVLRHRNVDKDLWAEALAAAGTSAISLPRVHLVPRRRRSR